MPWKHFRCRFCDWLTQAQYYGQWETDFPTCGRCGVSRGGVDAVDSEVHWIDRIGGNAYRPRHDALYLSSRFGEGTEVLPRLPPRYGTDPFHRTHDPIMNATFRCRDCGMNFEGRYDGQWDTTFPSCRNDRSCGSYRTGGRVDCLDHLPGGFSSRKGLSYLSSRFGPGSEFLDPYPELITAPSRPRGRSRSLSPKREPAPSPYQHGQQDRGGYGHSLPYRSREYERRDERPSSSFRQEVYDARVKQEAGYGGGAGVKQEYGYGDTRVKQDSGYGGYTGYDQSRHAARQPSTYNTPPSTYSGHGPPSDFVNHGSRSSVQESWPNQVQRGDFAGNDMAYGSRSSLPNVVDSRTVLNTAAKGGAGTAHQFASRNVGTPNVPTSDIAQAIRVGSPAPGRNHSARNRKFWAKSKAKPNPPTPAVTDSDAYCLSCHPSGHRAVHCPGEGPPEKKKKEHLDSLVPNLENWRSSTGRPKNMHQLIALHALVEMTPEVERPFLQKRDSLLAKAQLIAHSSTQNSADNQKLLSHVVEGQTRSNRVVTMAMKQTAPAKAKRSRMDALEVVAEITAMKLDVYGEIERLWQHDRVREGVVRVGHSMANACRDSMPNESTEPHVEYMLQCNALLAHFVNFRDFAVASDERLKLRLEKLESEACDRKAVL